MERKELEERLGHLRAQRQQVATTLERLNGGIMELEWLMSQEVEGTEGVPSDAQEEGGDAE